MTAKLDELKKYFIMKTMPPPLPQMTGNKETSRYDILKSFGEAAENIPEPVKKSYLIPIVIVAIIVIAAVIFFSPIKFR
jgi:hypothetical protein